MPILGTIASQVPGKISSTSFESIATVYITSDTNTVTFSSIPSTYKHLQLRGISRSNYNSSAVGASQYKIQFNEDTGANYSQHVTYGNGSSILTSASGTANQITGSHPWANAGGFGAGKIVTPTIIEILDYANTNKNKTVRLISGFEANTTSTNQFALFQSGAWYSTSAITSIVLDATGPNAFSDGPFAANSTWALYGIKG